MMEWVQGDNLKNFNEIKLKKNKFGEEKDFVRMFLLLIEEMKKFHDRNIIHRDIKSENIM